LRGDRNALARDITSQSFRLCARRHSRAAEMAGAIAALEGTASVQTHHLSEAIQYRTLDRKLWG
jgi:magnesium chelatase family protein